MLKLPKFQKLNIFLKIILIIVGVILSLILVIIIAYLILSHGARYTNTFGKESLETTLENPEIIDNNFPLINSKITIILRDDQNKPYAYETHTLQRIIPTYDPGIEEFRYWMSIDVEVGYFPQGTQNTEQAKKYIESDGESETTSKEEPCSMQEFDYHNICIMDDRPRGIDLAKFEGVKVGMSSNELWEFLGYSSDRGGGGGDGPFQGKYSEDHYILNGEGLNFLIVGYDINPSRNPDTSKLQGIYIVKDDKTFVGVPTNPDGTFNFESALKEIE